MLMQGIFLFPREKRKKKSYNQNSKSKGDRNRQGHRNWKEDNIVNTSTFSEEEKDIQGDKKFERNMKKKRGK